VRKLSEDRQGRHCPKINFGGDPFWAAVSYSASSRTEVANAELCLARTADETTAHWYPDVAVGFIEAARSETPCRLLVEVARIEAHPQDTTSAACRSLGLKQARIDGSKA